MTLQQYLKSVQHAPFKWGEHDCAMFPAKAWDSRRGGTVYADAVRTFGINSSRSYSMLLRAGTTLLELASYVMGEPLNREPMEGDVVLIGSGRRASLGIAVPPLVLVASDPGYVPVPMNQVTAVWGFK